MRFTLFYQSLVSDWNHGNAHFLRGVARELVRRGHHVRVFEPVDGWSRTNLIAEQGEGAIAKFHTAFPELTSETYDLADPGVGEPLDEAVEGADVVIVHEWSEPALVRHLGLRRAGGGRFRLLFHDTHHRAASLPQALAVYDLSPFDGVLAFGASVAERYRAHGWGRRVWTWHEAADTALFHPLDADKEGDLVWIGNWGDEERTAEVREFLLRPVRDLGLVARVHGVRYPASALAELQEAGVVYAGWLPNVDVAGTFARFRATVHVPRRPYAAALPGIPTIRVFEALACGIPLVSAPWQDAEGLFRVGEDFLIARDGNEMKNILRGILADPAWAESLSRHGLETIRTRHTCAHRVDELLTIIGGLGANAAVEAA
ncbi:MAG TPA: glycosyltransferase [Azospirillaceae bacterium]|nr:glycosyltransferase [Azospirillaceae bacterium]